MKKFKWYIINTHLGFEYSVKKNLIEKIKKYSFNKYFKHIFIPIEVIKRQKINFKKHLPGYILVKFYLTSKTWLLIKQIPKVVGFLGGGNIPMNLYKNDIKDIYNIIKQHSATYSQKKYDVGNLIKIIHGPFINFNGIINKVNLEKKKVNVTVFILGRKTPVDLDFNSIDTIK